jgi:hypothetical protein
LAEKAKLIAYGNPEDFGLEFEEEEEETDE